MFELIVIKEVIKPWQKRQGTEVWELPFKTMYYNGYAEANRFSVYKGGYVRKMVVNPTSNASYSCYQLNKTRKSDEYFKILKKSAEQLNLQELSMGMSSDYEQAILNGSTYLRLGTIIFGKRNLN